MFGNKMVKLKNENVKKKKKRLIIYLGDPVHNFIPSRDIWTIPLNICNIASCVKPFYSNQVEIHLFKFSDLMLKAINKCLPDIVGLSNYIGSPELSKKLIEIAKEKCPETITIAGDPNIT